MNKTKKSPAKTIVAMLLFSIVIIAVYFALNRRTSPLLSNNDDSTSEVEVLVTKNIEENYPSTPREVMKLYSRIMKCLYNENLKENQIGQLTEQMRVLFDEELLLNNSYEEQILGLNNEIAEFSDKDTTIINYQIENSSEVVYWDSEDAKFASIIAGYTLKINGTTSTIYEKFLLRQDTNSNWKILGWEVADEKSDMKADEE